MSGAKSITLYNGKAQQIHPRYRYKQLQSAVNRAIRLGMEGQKFVQIWDLRQGQELGHVMRHYNAVTLFAGPRRS